MKAFPDRLLDGVVAIPEISGIIERAHDAVLVTHPAAQTLPRAHAQALKSVGANAYVTDKAEMISAVLRHGQIAGGGPQKPTGDR